MANDMELVAGVAIASFLLGALFMLIAMIATSVRLEDKATLMRRDRRLRLREAPPGHMAASARWVNGFGQRYRNIDEQK